MTRTGQFYFTNIFTMTWNWKHVSVGTLVSMASSSDEITLRHFLSLPPLGQPIMRRCRYGDRGMKVSHIVCVHATRVVLS